MDKLISSYEKKNKEQLANKLRAISKAKIIREAQEEIQHTIKPRGISNILHIEVQDPSSPNKVIEIHNQDEIEESMKINFKRKCVEVYDTPLPHKPFISWFRHDGLTFESLEVLKGEFLFPPVIHPDKVSNNIKEAPEYQYPVDTRTL